MLLEGNFVIVFSQLMPALPTSPYNQYMTERLSLCMGRRASFVIVLNANRSSSFRYPSNATGRSLHQWKKAVLCLPSNRSTPSIRKQWFIDFMHGSAQPRWRDLLKIRLRLCGGTQPSLGEGPSTADRS
jgi:hypothetical protein